MKRDGQGFSLRLNAWFAAVLIALSIALFLASYSLLYRAVKEKAREGVRAQLEVYRAWYAEGGLSALNTRFAEQQDTEKESFFVRVVGPDGAALFASVPRSADFDLSKLQGLTHDEAFKWLTLPARNRDADWLIATAQLPDGAVMQVGKTTEALAALLDEFLKLFGWVALIALLLGVAGGAWMTRRALRPIQQLIGAVKNVIATGRMDERMPEPGSNNEVGQLARLFNTMLRKNDALIRGMREALDNVAHDLRTPLTRARGTAEAALNATPDANVYRDALLDSMEETDCVLTMLNTLMDISEAENGLMKLDLETVPLAALVEEVVEIFEFVAQEKSITVANAVPAGLTVHADRNRLRQVLVNLLDNALKFTPNGGRVEIASETRADEICITVTDTGAGIAPEEIPRIWDRLYRGDKSRAQRGLGLGLSLVKAITLAHGGKVTLESTPGQGSSFSIHLPLANLG
jgi:heavy metal sensor kinase